MREKLFEIINQQPHKMLWIGKKIILVEEKYCKYRITSVFIKDDEILLSYIFISEDTFVHTSYIKDLSNTFIAQVLSEIL